MSETCLLLQKMQSPWVMLTLLKYTTTKIFWYKLAIIKYYYLHRNHIIYNKGSKSRKKTKMSDTQKTYLYQNKKEI